MCNNSNLIIRDLISRVNSKLGYYESGYVSAERTPHTDKERCNTFEHYIECLFNYEAYSIPELFDMVDELSGHLFRCTAIEEPDEEKRKFKSVTIELITDGQLEEYVIKEKLSEEVDTLKDELQSIIKFLGGSKINFNSVRKKIKFSIA